jgi:hypothetical protein
MKLINREIFVPPKNGRPVMPAFITYIDPDKPVILQRYGREDYSDAYDDYVDVVSRDNGQTWSEPELHLKSVDTKEGKVRFGEQAALFEPERNRLIVVVNRSLYPNDTLDADTKYELYAETLDTVTGSWTGPAPIGLDHPTGVAMSFCVPLKTRAGKLIFPGQTNYVDADGKPVHYKGCWSPAGVITHLIGECNDGEKIEWHWSKPVVPDLERTSRGFYEPTIAELADGRFMMVLRGDNSMYPDRPGYKWLAISEDECESWTQPEPFGCNEGDPIESSSTGSTSFRSLTDGKLYWIGNLCIDGERPNGNFPRSPLVIAEIDETIPAIKRNTIFVIDRCRPGETPKVQHSNFRFYQDRATGDVVLFLTRYGENGYENNAWMNANYYRYRIGQT